MPNADKKTHKERKKQPIAFESETITTSIEVNVPRKKKKTVAENCPGESTGVRAVRLIMTPVLNRWTAVG